MVKNEDGTLSRGYKLATLRTLLDHAGLLTHVALSPIQYTMWPLCRPLLEQASCCALAICCSKIVAFSMGPYYRHGSANVGSMSSCRSKPTC